MKDNNTAEAAQVAATRVQEFAESAGPHRRVDPCSIATMVIFASLLGNPIEWLKMARGGSVHKHVINERAPILCLRPHVILDDEMEGPHEPPELLIYQVKQIVRDGQSGSAAEFVPQDRKAPDYLTYYRKTINSDAGGPVLVVDALFKQPEIRAAILWLADELDRTLNSPTPPMRLQSEELSDLVTKAFEAARDSVCSEGRR